MIAKNPLLLVSTLCVLCALARNSAAVEPTYWQDIRPVFRKHCTVCHSAKNLKEQDVSGGLALDTFESALKRTSQAPVIRPGRSADSRLVKLLLAANADRRMPKDARPLPPETIDLIRRWIDAGAREGKKMDESTAAIPSAGPKRTRKLNVVLPTSAVPPKGVLGPAAPAKLELALKVGPLAPVAAVAFSPDGKLLAAGSYGRVAIWDLTAVKPVKVLTNVLGAVNDLRFSPDGKLLAVAGGQPSARGDLRLYRLGDWKLLETLGGHDDVVFSVAFNREGTQLASASFDKTVRLWDVSSGKLIRVFSGHSDFVYAVAFGPDGKWLVSCGKDKTVQLRDVATGKSRFTFSGMNEDVITLAVSPDGKSVVSSGVESNLYWWDPQKGGRVRVGGGHSGTTHEIAFSKDGKLIVSGGADGTVRLWNGETSALVRTFSVGPVVYAVAISADARRVAAGSFDGLTRLFSADGRLLVTLLTLPAEGDSFDWLALTPEGFAAASPGLSQRGGWRMGSQVVSGDPVWQALGREESVAKALRGETLAAPIFKK